MKDLAGQDYSSKSKVKIPPQYMKLGLVVVVVFVAMLLIKLFSGGGSISGGSSNSSILLSEAPRGLTPVAVAGSNVSAKGVNLSTQTAAMKIVRKEVSGSATATRTYGAGTYTISVSAKLPDPGANSYEVWLTDGTNLVPVDFMRGSGSNWSLDVSDADKFSKYDQIWITLERAKDTKPEEHIVEGSF